MTSALALTLGISLAIQASFFIFAAAARTDKVTDLSYGLTFIALATVLLGRTAGPSGPQIALALMIVAWGVRLAGYLFYRILRIHRDARFDGIREQPLKFLQFWFFQGVAVWVILLPTILWFARPGSAGGWTGWMTAGAAVWLTGLVIETVADIQKYRFKRAGGARARWVDRGLWRYSRHPNYFGELLCWWGLFVFVLPDPGWWLIVGAAGPLAITALLLFGTGIPTLEKSAQEKWGQDPEYLAYRRRTNRLVPWFPQR
jgi:steroid 5-alpha reductase family enzyme